MNRTIVGLMILATVLSLASCATYTSAVPAGTGIGAGAGALLGYGMTGNGLGAAAGAGAGALAGALTGVVIDETRRQRTAAPAHSYHAPPAQYRAAPQAYAAQPDPTKGELLNHTRWRLEIYLDHARDPILLSARQSYPLNLDIGDHLVVAKAYVATQFGERLVGTYERDVYVDPRSSGWGLRFDEEMF